jgi:hypothetical protein
VHYLGDKLIVILLKKMKYNMKYMNKFETSYFISKFVKLFKIASILLFISHSVSEVNDDESPRKVFKLSLIQIATMADVNLRKETDKTCAFSQKTCLDSLINSDIF